MLLSIHVHFLIITYIHISYIFSELVSQCVSIHMTQFFCILIYGIHLKVYCYYPISNCYCLVLNCHCPISKCHCLVLNCHCPIPNRHYLVLNCHCPLPNCHCPTLNCHCPIPNCHCLTLNCHCPNTHQVFNYI